jgi:hypothetical protein
MVSMEQKEDKLKMEKKRIKPRWLTFLENFLVGTGCLIFLGYLYTVYAYEYNFSYVTGTISGMCEQGTRKGVEVNYSIKNKSYIKCDKRHEDEGFEIGDKVYLRVLNGFNSFAWIDIEKTKKKGIPPRE